MDLSLHRNIGLAGAAVQDQVKSTFRDCSWHDTVQALWFPVHVSMNGTAWLMTSTTVDSQLPELYLSENLD